MVSTLTASQVTKAGRCLRHAMMGEDVDPEVLSAATDVLLAFRAAHARPLVTANNGLRSMIRTAGCDIEVSQRLKRVPTILDKLVREPTLALARMQDIGGCRAVLNSIEEVRRVEMRIRRNKETVGYSDYIENPRSSGYRGVHVVVKYGGRQIEIQLRTRVMHAWAITVERLSWRVRRNLKASGTGDLRELLALVSRLMAMEEIGEHVPSELLDELEVLRARSAAYL